MADDTAAASSADDSQVSVTFNVKAANDQKHVVTLPVTTTVADLKTKLSTSEYADIPVERQRLIYSGRVLKDHDTIASVKIKDGHTVHLVKAAASNARQNPANQGSSGTTTATGTPTPQVPTNIAAGTGNNPLAGLTGARYAGFHGLPGMDMFGPDGGMGPPPTHESMLEMMDNPMFLQQMNEAMNNPAVVDMMMQNPMIRDNPMLQEMLRNPETRRMMFSPEMMRMQLQMQRAMNRSAPGGASSFPAPGATDNTPQSGATATGTDSASGTTTTPRQQTNPFAHLFAGGPNPFAPSQQNANTNTNTGSTSTPQNQQDPTAAANPFANLFGVPQGQANPIADAARNMMQNPEAMRQMMQMMGGDGNAGQNPLAALLGGGEPFGSGAGFGSPPPPADTRPPEQIYETQLAQLNEMGFYEFDRNISALRRSGGNVQGAIEYLLNGGT